jgi:AcrR family transcriptional regulator
MLSAPNVSTKRRRPNTTARLLDAAFAVFAERGFQSASIEQVCEAAGFTRGAFYSNYKSKDELFIALFDRNAGRILERVRELIGDQEAEAAVASLIKFFTEPSPDDRDWYLISMDFTLHAIRNPEAAKVLAQHDRALRQEMIPLIVEVFAKAGRKPRIDPDRIARTIVALTEGAAAQSYVEPDALPPGTLEKELFPIIFEAIAS